MKYWDKQPVATETVQFVLPTGAPGLSPVSNHKSFKPNWIIIQIQLVKPTNHQTSSNFNRPKLHETCPRLKHFTNHPTTIKTLPEAVAIVALSSGTFTYRTCHKYTSFIYLWTDAGSPVMINYLLVVSTPNWKPKKFKTTSQLLSVIIFPFYSGRGRKKKTSSVLADPRSLRVSCALEAVSLRGPLGSRTTCCCWCPSPTPSSEAINIIDR